MNKSELLVNGYRLKSEEEKKAALRDLEKIEILKNCYHLDEENDIRQLYSCMQTEGITFETVVGRDFDDCVYEKYKELNTDKSKLIEKKNKNDLKGIDKESDNQKNRPIRNYDKQRKFIIFIASLVGICCIGYFSFYSFLMYKNDKNQEEMSHRIATDTDQEKIVYDPIKDKGKQSEESEIADLPPVLLEKYKNLYSDNKKLIGWIKIDDTSIDYPVLQTVDNEYYLTHGYNQDYDKNGSIFLDSECLIYPRSTNLIVYGHRMKSGKMFGTLSQYQNEDFFMKHRVIHFDTLYEEADYEVMYAFRSKVYSEEEITFKYYQFIEPNSEAEFLSAMNEMDEMKFYDTGVTAEYGDMLLTLSTCDYAQEDGRFVVVAKKITVN